MNNVVQDLLLTVVSGQGVSAEGRMGLILSFLHNRSSAAADARLMALNCLLPCLFELAGHDVLGEKAWRAVCSAVMAFIMVCCAKR